jgi:hypothetical protein
MRAVRRGSLINPHHPRNQMQAQPSQGSTFVFEMAWRIVRVRMPSLWDASGEVSSTSARSTSPAVMEMLARLPSPPAAVPRAYLLMFVSFLRGHGLVCKMSTCHPNCYEAWNLIPSAEVRRWARGRTRGKKSTIPCVHRGGRSGRHRVVAGVAVVLMFMAAKRHSDS